VTVGSILEGAFRLIKERPGALLLWIVIQLLVTIASSYALMLIVQGQIDAYLAGATESEVGVGYLVQTLLITLAGLVVSSILYAAALRAVLRPGEGGPGALRLGMDEVRTFLLTLLYVIIFFVGMIVLTFIFALFMGGAGTRTAGAGAIIVMVLVCVIGAYFGTKLSLTYPLTLMRESFAIGEGWSLTDGRFWTLFGAYLILFLIMLVVAVASTVATDWEYFQLIAQYGLNSEQADAFTLREVQQLAAGDIDAMLILKWVLGGVQGGLFLALGAGAVGTAAKELTADEDGLTDTFA